MGEAKRRKLLDSTFGKKVKPTQSQTEEQILLLAKGRNEFQKYMDLTLSAREILGFPFIYQLEGKDYFWFAVPWHEGVAVGCRLYIPVEDACSFSRQETLRISNIVADKIFPGTIPVGSC